jgi:hypothetical protein
VSWRRTWLWALVALVAACSPPAPDRPDWVIRSRLVFRSDDLSREHAPLPRGSFRLLFPFVCGDLYGSPTTGDFLHPVLRADGSFELDLNRGHPSLLASLEPTELSLPYLHITPSGARLARLAPVILETDGIEPLGRVSWLDPDSGAALLLLYLDRPAAITGQTLTAGRAVRYAISVSAPGYVWVGKQTGPNGDVYSVVPRPSRLQLAVGLPDAPP